MRRSFGESLVPEYLYSKSKSRSVKVVNVKVQAHDNPFVNISGHFFASIFFLNVLQTDLVSHSMFRIMLVAPIRCSQIQEVLRTEESKNALQWKRRRLGVPDYLRMMTGREIIYLKGWIVSMREGSALY